MKAKIYHNSRCSKSRQTLEILKKNNIDIEVIEYLKFPLDKNQISDLLKKLNLSARELLRRGEEIYRKENLSNKDFADEFLIDAMVKNPILIERPIVTFNNRAIIGRPPEKVLEIIWNLKLIIRRVLEK